jgi:hypothetical protein
MNITDLESGECRWFLREDIHVYCKNPHPRADGSARYCVVCPDAGLDYGHWVTADEAAVAVHRAYKQGVPA